MKTLYDQLKPHIKDGSIKTLQKTFRDGSLQTGRESTERMVIYQSDSKANVDDSGIMNTILTWLEFTHPNSMNLEIQNFPGEPTNIVLKVPGFSDLNINNIVGALDLGDLSLKDNVSQFINIQLFKNKIDRDLLIKLIRQSNELFSVVATLHESFEHIMMCMGAPVITEYTQEKISENLNESVYIHNDRLLTDFIKGLSSLSGKIKEFEKFEKELEKYKDELTPGTMGES